MPMKRNCPSDKLTNLLKVSRHNPGMMNGHIPSITSIIARPSNQ